MSFKSHIEKTWIFSCEHRVHILMSFKSYIKRILCYSFKLKYLNQKIFHPTLKKHNFFLKNIEYIYTNRFQISHLKKNRVSPGSPASRVDPLGRSSLAESLYWSVFWQTQTDPRVNLPYWCGFNNYGLKCIMRYRRNENASFIHQDYKSYKLYYKI
jgi:hypothetical protein